MNSILTSISTIKNFMGNASHETCNEYLYAALQDAVESMEKQIPKKSTFYDNRGNKSACLRCQRCFEALRPGKNYCSNCGQAIDWSNYTICEVKMGK